MMDKEAKRKYSPATRSHQKVSRSRFVFIVLVAILMSGFFVFHYRNHLFFISPLFSKINQWMENHETHVQTQLAMDHSKKKVAKDKLSDTNKSIAETEIHFEFYNTLPTMQVNVPVSTNMAENQGRRPDIKPIAGPAVTPSASMKINITNADELERELSKHIQQTKEKRSLATNKHNQKKNIHRE